MELENKMDKIITTNSEYNLKMHKLVLGVHPDKDGNEFPYQPKRSKREDQVGKVYHRNENGTYPPLDAVL